MKKQLAARTEDGQRTNDFFPFVINPKSFTQTVENLFDYSFLVKQGDASIRVSLPSRHIQFTFACSLRMVCPQLDLKK